MIERSWRVNPVIEEGLLLIDRVEGAKIGKEKCARGAKSIPMSLVSDGEEHGLVRKVLARHRRRGAVVSVRCRSWDVSCADIRLQVCLTSLPGPRVRRIWA